MTLMTRREYLLADGLLCPSCRSTNIEAYEIDADGTIADGLVRCHDCNASWNDMWDLTGYDEFEAHGS